MYLQICTYLQKPTLFCKIVPTDLLFSPPLLLFVLQINMRNLLNLFFLMILVLRNLILPNLISASGNRQFLVVVMNIN